MYKLYVIARREYAAMVATKAFMVTLIMMPILMFGGMILMPKISSLGGGKTQRILVADGTGQLFEPLKAMAEARNDAIRQMQKQPSESSKEKEGETGKAPKKQQGFGEKQDFYQLELADVPRFDDARKLSLSEEIRDGKLYAFVEIPEGVMSSSTSAVYVSQDALLSSGRQWLSSVVSEQVRAKRLNQMGLDPIAISTASQPIEFTPMSPYKANAAGEIEVAESSNVLLTLFLPFGVMMLMFMVIFLAAQPMLESGMEEKGHRIAEVLLGSVNPTQLMAGKLLGNVAGSLMIFAIYGIGGWVVLDTNGWSKSLPWEVVPWFIVFQLLGVLFFSSIFLTIGASISELKEAQSLLMPVWLVLVAPMMVWFAALQDPNGPIATGMSFFPPSTPLMMILRLASGQTIPWWQPPLAALLLVVSTAGVISLAGKIYRNSLLRNDSARTFRQLLARLRGTN